MIPNLWPFIALAMLVSSGYGGWRLNDLYTSEVRLREAEATAATIQAAADAIAKVPPKYITINKTLETQVKEHTFYETCKNTPEVMKTVNDALKGGK